MTIEKVLLPIALLIGVGLAFGGATGTPNQLIGTWRMVAATLEEGRRVTKPYGARLAGLLVFTPDMHFVEVLTDAGTRPFVSERRGKGTDLENRRAMASAIGFYGSYSVDRSGRFAGNLVEGATFPNWVGSVRSTRELMLEVRGERLIETFKRPGGGLLRAEYHRVNGPLRRENQ